MGKKIVSHTDLAVYRKSFDVAMDIFRLSKSFPKEETYSLTDQIRRASRSVSANLGEAWRKRRYEAAFVSKLNDAESEAGETKSGSNLPSNAVISIATRPPRFTKSMKKSSACSSP
jgi:four helix bundle protein